MLGFVPQSNLWLCNLIHLKSAKAEPSNKGQRQTWPPLSLSRVEEARHVNISKNVPQPDRLHEVILFFQTAVGLCCPLSISSMAIGDWPGIKVSYSCPHFINRRINNRTPKDFSHSISSSVSFKSVIARRLGWACETQQKYGYCTDIVLSIILRFRTIFNVGFRSSIQPTWLCNLIHLKSAKGEQ